MTKYLYFEPTIYMPYKLSLRRKNSICLTQMWIENGEEIDLIQYAPKPRRWSNPNFITMVFPTPLYMDVEPSDGIDEIVTFAMKYSLDFGDGNTANLVHRQHVAIRQKGLVLGQSIQHYTTRMAIPSIFGVKGKDYIDNVLNSRDAQKVMQYGMLEEDMKTWGLESFDVLYPNSPLQHGVSH